MSCPELLISSDLTRCAAAATTLSPLFHRKISAAKFDEECLINVVRPQSLMRDV